MQEQITFTTPRGRHAVVIKGYLTGRDEVAIQDAIQKRMQITFGTGDPSNPNGAPAPAKLSADASVLTAGQDKALELMLVSVDGATDDLLTKVLDMHRDDYRLVVEEVNKVTAPMNEEKKSDSLDKPSPPAGEAPVSG